MALHSRDAVTVSAAVAMRSRADYSSMEDHRRQCHQMAICTSISTALVIYTNVIVGNTDWKKKSKVGLFCGGDNFLDTLAVELIQ